MEGEIEIQTSGETQLMLAQFVFDSTDPFGTEERLIGSIAPVAKTLILHMENPNKDNESITAQMTLSQAKKLGNALLKIANAAEAGNRTWTR